MEQVKLLSMTVILAVLIWASADSLVNEAVSIPASFEPVPAAGSNMLITTQPTSEVYELQISGPRKAVEDVQALAPLQVRFNVVEQPTGPTVLHLDRATLKRQMAEKWNEFRKLTVVSVVPETLPVLIDHWITEDVDVVVKRLGLAYEVEPQLQRTTVKVRMRETRLREWPAGQPLQIDITADAERLLRDQPAGQSLTIPVTLDARAFGPEAELTPSTIEVTATLKAQRRTARIPTIPILVAVSFANLEKSYRPVGRDGASLSLVTQTISVTGPTDAVTRLERGTTRAYGIIQLKEDDLQQLDTLKLITPEYHLPQGIELAEEPPPIEFKLIDGIDTSRGS